MENGNNEQIQEKQPAKRTDGKDKNLRTALYVMAALLFICVLFSGIQSLYIFRLNSGLEGILSYTKIFQGDETEPGDAPVSTIESLAGPEATKAPLPDPWFSIEEAASVSSPDKKRLSVVEIFKQVSPATVSLSIISNDTGKDTKIGSGTGFIITDTGYIVTNQHVVDMSDQGIKSFYVTVVLPGETEPVKAEIIGSDVQTDIAVLKVNTDKKLPCVTLGDSDTLQAGELAVVIGNAMGTFDDTVTVGIISAPSREINRGGYYVDIIQTDAAINPGNSGGPVINSFGEVIGITNAKIATSTSENLGFAIPINSVKGIIESIINYGKVVGRTFLGVSVQYVAEDSYAGARGGVYVADIVKNGPSDKAGLRLGDIILKLDGVEIKEPGDIIKVREAHKVGDSIEVVVDRDGKQITLTLTIGDSADA